MIDRILDFLVKRLGDYFYPFVVAMIIGAGVSLVLSGFWVGLKIGDAKLARAEAKQISTERDALKSAVNRMQAEKSRADMLETLLNEAANLREQQALEHSREIDRLTRRVPCLNAGTVRLLNQSRGIAPAALPEAAKQPDAEDAAAATDTDVARWIDHAARQYDTCRDRLGALIDFNQGE